MRPFPFTAIVGMPDLRLSLILSAVSPAIGGVLVRGEKGTAKSTMVRALAGLLPDVDAVDQCRFSCDPSAPDPACPDGPHPAGSAHRRRRARLVELPVGAAEDRVVGSLNLERALSEGVTDYQPGLLASAHRGLLYVDEVNLLHDHLVDVLLDAAAMGRVTVEREGVSVSHAARFVLIGTMNPEEGELRPQLLDRFGLTVEVGTSHDPQERVEVVRRRMAYENDPDDFADTYADAEAELAKKIDTAQQLLPSVQLTDDALLQIAEVCASFQVDGMRADIVMARTAAAHAAWSGRDLVSTEDIRVAARLTLPHRRRRNPFDAPGVEEQELDQALSQTDRSEAGDGPEDDPPPDGPEGGGPGSGPPGPTEEDRQDGQRSEHGERHGEQHGEQTPQNGEHGSQQGGQGPTNTVEPDAPYRARLMSVAGSGAGEYGKRSRAITDTGRTIGVWPRTGRGGQRARTPHLVATLHAAAPHQHARGRTGAGLVVAPQDVRYAKREGKESNLVLFCVDASGSMGARQRMTEVKSAVLSLLLDAYQRRDKVGLVTFRAAEATLALPPTTSVEIAASRLEALPTGGRTPLAEGLLTSAETLRTESVRDPRRRPLLVVVTDGRATNGSDAVARAQHAADLLAGTGVATVVMDCETGRMRLGLAGELAERLGGEHVPLGEVAADTLTGEIKARTGGQAGSTTRARRAA